MPYQPFKGRIPNDRWYCQEHDMWVLETDDGSGGRSGTGHAGGHSGKGH